MFNNFQNQGYMNNGFYPNPGVQYAQRPQAKMTQTLTPEQIKQLRSNGGTFDLKVSETDMLKAICTHKENGNIVLIDNNDGTVTCPICGATFSILSADQETVNDATKLIYDVLQSIKTMYLDAPENVMTSFMQIIPLLEKTPKLYSIAMNNFNKYETTNPMQNAGSAYGFNALNALTNPAFGAMGGMAQAPMMGGFQPQPYQPYQPQPMMGNANPFGYGMPPQAPMMNTPEQAQPNNAPQTDANAQQQTVNSKVFNV